MTVYGKSSKLLGAWRWCAPTRIRFELMPRENRLGGKGTTVLLDAREGVIHRLALRFGDHFTRDVVCLQRAYVSDLRVAVRLPAVVEEAERHARLGVVALDRVRMVLLREGAVTEDGRTRRPHLEGKLERVELRHVCVGSRDAGSV